MPKCVQQVERADEKRVFAEFDLHFRFPNRQRSSTAAVWPARFSRLKSSGFRRPLSRAQAREGEREMCGADRRHLASKSCLAAGEPARRAA